jgi:single-strand DNA-binding protein
MLMNNLVMLKGRLGADAEIRTTTSGDRVANLRVVTTDTYKAKETGEWKERTEWHRLTVWGEGTVKYLENHGKKGALVDVLGQIRTKKWTKDGVEHYSTEIVVDYRAGGEVRITSTSSGAKQDPAEREDREDQAA